MGSLSAWHWIMAIVVFLVLWGERHRISELLFQPFRHLMEGTLEYDTRTLLLWHDVLFWKLVTLLLMILLTMFVA